MRDILKSGKFAKVAVKKDGNEVTHYKFA